MSAVQVASVAVRFGLIYGRAVCHVAADVWVRRPDVLRIAAVPQSDVTRLPMQFAISVGVRKEDEALAQELEAALKRASGEIRALLASYGVPQIEVRPGLGLR